jgi:beta-lactamase class A
MINVFSFLITVYLAAATAQPGDRELYRRFQEIAGTAGGRVGIGVELLETGESVTLNGNGQFPMQSVYKLPIAMAVLQGVDRGDLRLEQRIRVETGDLVPRALHSPLRDRHPRGAELSVRELLRLMISESDGTACDVLLRLRGTESVMRFLRGVGVDSMVVATTEKAMARDEMVQYRNWASPEGALKLIRALHEGRGLTAASKALLLQWMTGTETGLRRIKGLLPAGTLVAHKTGTSGTTRGLTRATNDVGLITLPDGRHLAVAVFVSDSTADQARRERVIAETARAAWERFASR